MENMPDCIRRSFEYFGIAPSLVTKKDAQRIAKNMWAMFNRGRYSEGPRSGMQIQQYIMNIERWGGPDNSPS